MKDHTKLCKKCHRELPATAEYFTSNKNKPDGLEYRCKECRGLSFGIYLRKQKPASVDGYKICTRCERELPADTVHFFSSKGKLIAACKECLGRRFVRQVIPLAKDGYKICWKCKRELPADETHFFRKNNGLLHSPCKECRGMRFVHRIVATPQDGYRICTKCKKLLELTSANFYKEPRKRDGFSSDCKACRLIVTRQWERFNPEKKREYLRRYRRNNPEKARAIWRQANPEKARARKVRRRARKRSLPDTLTHSQWLTCLEHFNNCCAFCGKQRDFWHTIEMEHYIPLTSPECTGTVAANIIPACRSCNASKSNIPVDVFLQRKFPKDWREILTRIEAYFKWVQEQDSE